MKFDFNKVKDFEKHIELSIPNLLTLDNIFRQITHEYAQPESTVIDLGCSTGRFLTSLNQLDDCNYVGIDEVDMKNRQEGFEFIQGDSEDFLDDNESISVLISMFFLQFCGNTKRKRLLSRFKNYIDAGAILLVAEKVYLNDPHLQQSIHRLHIQEKRKGFSDEQILDKDLELSVSMFCKTEMELEDELKSLGRVSKVWQSYNFMGYVVKK
tara:strand:+ start:963 stop:1595 length:633 start_codon:yes stop_codon:yes gene_type:complete